MQAALKMEIKPTVNNSSVSGWGEIAKQKHMLNNVKQWHVTLT